MDADTKRFLDRLVERFEARDDDTKRYLDGLLERHVTITQELIEAMHANFAALQAEMRTHSTALQAEIADQREQIQANTAAIWAMLDRFGPEPQA